MGALASWVRALLNRVRERSPLAAHALRAGDRYVSVNGSLLAAGLTYYGFLAVFPLLAVVLGASAVAARIVPSIDVTLREQLGKILPEGIDLDAIASAGLTVGAVGLVVLLYAGVRWVGSLRRSLYLVWGTEPREVPFVPGLIRDAIALLLLGVCLLGSVAVTVLVTVFTGAASRSLGLGGAWLALLVQLLGLLVSVATDVVAFSLIYRALPPRTSDWRSIVHGAVIAALGFEVLKQAAALIAAGASGNVIYGTFAATLGLVLWIGYASRLVLMAGAWIVTTTPSASR